MNQPAALEDELDIPDPNIGKVCRELIAQNKNQPHQTISLPA